MIRKQYMPVRHTIPERMLSWLVTIVMLLGCMPLDALAEEEYPNAKGFSLNLEWNQDNSESVTDLWYDSEKGESRGIRLKVSYKNDQVSDEYAPGSIRITVPGIRSAVREGSSAYEPISIAADKEGAGEKYYNWSYSYTYATDTYTFVNNFSVAAQSVFEGSFEIMWTLPSRSTRQYDGEPTDPDCERDKLQAELFADGVYTASNIVTYRQDRKKDDYELNIKGTAVYNDPLPDVGNPPQDADGNEIEYIWVKYSVGGEDHYKARDVKDRERFEVYIEEGAYVCTQYSGLIETDETRVFRVGDTDRTYRKYYLYNNIDDTTKSPYIDNIYVAYPKPKFDDKDIVVFAELYGTYYEEESETLLAEASCKGNKDDYFFKDLPGDIYDVFKESFGIHNDYIDKNYPIKGAVDSVNLVDGKGQYYSDLKLYLRYNPIIKEKEDQDLNHNGIKGETYQRIDADYYDLEFVDDILDISTKERNPENGQYIRQLEDHEYCFTHVYIPSNSEIVNSNGLPIRANAYDVEVYVRYEGEPKNEFKHKISEEGLKIKAKSTLIAIDDYEGKKAVGVKVLVHNVKEGLSPEKASSSAEKTPEAFYSTIVRVYYTFRMTEEAVEKIVTDGGLLTNNMYFNLYRTLGDEIKDEWVNEGFKWTEGVENDEDKIYSDEWLYNRDLDYYGEGYDRESDDVPIVEIPHYFSMKSVTIKENGEDENSRFFTASMLALFEMTADTPVSNLSMYTIIPENLRLPEKYSKDPEALLNALTFSSSNPSLTSAYIASHVKLTLVDDPTKYNGRQYLKLEYDFSDAPVDIGTIQVSGIPMYINKMDLTSGTRNITMYGAVLTHQPGIWDSNNSDHNDMEKGVWIDIDGDKNLDEKVSFASGSCNFSYTEQTKVELVKYVKTPLTNKLVNPKHDVEFANLPMTYADGTYSYFLKATVGSANVKNMVFVDVIEPTKNGMDEDRNVFTEWQGAFVDINFDDALAQMELPEGYQGPTVYYSEEEETFDRDGRGKDIINSDIFKTGNWKKTKPSVVRSIAVDFGEAIAKENTVLMLEIQMKAPKDTTYCKKVAKNSCSIGYNKQSSETKEYNVPEYLTSNIVPVTYLPKGRITLTKKDAVSKKVITGAAFTLYRMKGATPNIEADEKIGEYVVSENGKIIADNLDFGKYYFVEISAPTGYLVTNPDVPVLIDVDAEAQDVKVDYLNERKPGQISILKRSEQDKEQLIAGAKFGVFKSDGTMVASGTTKNDGTLTIGGLPWGSYYLQEIAAADGYYLSETKYPFTISEEYDAVAMHFTKDENGNDVTNDVFDLTNEQMPALVTLVKRELKGDPYADVTSGNVPEDQLDKAAVKGAVYTLFKKERDGTVTEITSKITDNDGKIYVEGLVFGDYYFIEETEAIGYKKNLNRIDFTLSAVHTRTDLVVYTADTRKTGTLSLKKKDDTGKNGLPGNPVEGAVYGLFNAETDERITVREDGGRYVYDANSTVKDLVTTNEGAIDVVGLLWGSYYIKELKAPVGYELNETVYPFTLTKENIAQQVIWDTTDDCLKGGIRLIKTAMDETTRLKDAEFTLFRSDGSVVAENLTTNDYGVLKVEGLDWGSYYFEETKAPNGYGLTSQKIRFSVNNLTAGRMQELMVTDPDVNYSLKVTKRILAEEIVFAHGNPTFLFKVTGSDGRIYRKAVTFSEDYVKTHTVNGYVEASVVFSLGIGTYTVTEESVSRYALIDITAKNADGEEVTAGIDKTEDSITVSLGGDSGQNQYTEIEFVFENEKTRQTGTSDTALLTNVLNRARKLTAISAIYDGDVAIPSTTDINDLKKDLAVWATYDDGTQVKLNDDQYSLEDVVLEQLSGPYSIRVIYDEDGIVREDSFEIIVTNDGLFKTVDLNNTPGVWNGIPYVKEVAITGYLGSSTRVDFPAMIMKILPDGTEEYYKVKKIGNGEVVGGMHLTVYTFEGDEQIKRFKNVQTITFAEGIEEIDDNAFSTSWAGNSSDYENYLQCELSFPSTLKRIGNSAFLQCVHLYGDLNIPDSVTDIGNRAFVECKGFKGRLHISENLSYIRMNTFYQCSGLSGDLVIPESVKQIGYGAFNGCNSFSALYMSGNNLTGISVSTASGENPESGAFENCTGFANVLTIPESVTTIGYNAFRNCSKLKLEGDLTLPAGLTSIGNGAFSSCSGLNGGLILPEGLTEIGNSAFAYCSNLTGDLYIPDTVTKLGNRAFLECSGFNGTIHISTGISEILMNTFYNCKNFTNQLIIPGNVKRIAYGAFYNCGFTSLELKYGVEEISYRFSGDNFEKLGAFENCKFTGQLTIPNSVKVIGQSAFKGQKFTGTLEIPGSVKQIGYGAFAGCTELQELILNEGIEEISVPLYDVQWRDEGSSSYQDKGSFEGCTGLTGELMIPSTVKIIGQNAFRECYNLSGDLTLPEGLKEISNLAFGMHSFDDGDLNHSKFGGKLTIPSTVTSIGDDAFIECNFDDLIIVESATSSLAIGHNAFSGWDSHPGSKIAVRKSYALPESVKSLGSDVFGFWWGKTIYISQKTELVNNQWGGWNTGFGTDGYYSYSDYAELESMIGELPWQE